MYSTPPETEARTLTLFAAAERHQVAEERETIYGADDDNGDDGRRDSRLFGNY